MTTPVIGLPVQWLPPLRGTFQDPPLPATVWANITGTTADLFTPFNDSPLKGVPNDDTGTTPNSWRPVPGL